MCFHNVYFKIIQNRMPIKLGGGGKSISMCVQRQVPFMTSYTRAWRKNETRKRQIFTTITVGMTFSRHFRNDSTRKTSIIQFYRFRLQLIKLLIKISNPARYTFFQGNSREIHQTGEGKKRRRCLFTAASWSAFSSWNF